MADSSLLLELFVTIGKVIWLYFQSIYYRLFPVYKNLKGEVVLITGGANGLGRLQALEYAKEGSTIILWDLDENDLSKVASEVRAHQATVHTYKVDVGQKHEVHDIAEKVKQEVGNPTILVNNAGIVTGKSLLELTDEEIERTFLVNAMSNFWTIRAFLPSMLEKNHGHIVTLSSAAAFTGVPLLTDYCASKAATFNLNEGLRREIQRLRKTGVKTTCACPFFVNTGMFRGAQTKLPMILPFLDEEDVAHKIVDAVRRNQELIVIPETPRLAFWFRAMLPTSCQDTLANFFGFQDFMSNFVGRVDKKRN